MTPVVAKYGSWKSSISPEMLAGGSLSLSDPRYHNGLLYWHESRPSEQGRGVIVSRHPDGKTIDLFDKPFSARSSVHEYGGRCYTLSDSHLFFVNASDQQIYCVALTSETGAVVPLRVTPEDNRRYADLEWNPCSNKVMAVCEDHRQPGEATTGIVEIDIGGHLDRGREVEPDPLVWGADFYAYPRISADQNQLCWLQWNHPDMPWFSTELWVAELSSQGLLNTRIVAGADRKEAIFQPQWHTSGALYFCSDRNDNWNLFRAIHSEIAQVTDFEGECGMPLWQFGMQSYAFLPEDRAICAVCEQGLWQLWDTDLVTSQSKRIRSDVSLIHQISSGEDGVLVVAGSPQNGTKIYALSADLHWQQIKSATEQSCPASAISLGRAVEFGTTDKMSAKGFFYPPCNPQCVGPVGDKPPLIVLCHGGPTAATSNALNLKVQFWTSRGFAVFDVNYRGSTGYGRQYRSLLDGKWGIYDVADACAAATYACEKGWSDPRKTIIRGSSAGGLTVLSALTSQDIFAAGACLYGIADLRILAGDTHKFEARYADSLIAPWPEGADEYDRRSPIHHIDQLNSPVIFFQGMRDKVVPANQAEMMVQALEKRGIPVSFITYPEEGHGFRSAETIVHSFNAELAFYGKIFGFKTDSSVEVVIRNFPE